MTVSIDSMVQRWCDPNARPLFKGSLIDAEGCCCAQGDVLRVAGFTDQQLRDLSQSVADREVAKLLDISVAHAVLLRIVNDRADGCPQDVLTHPEKVLGDKAHIILAFWKHLDSLSPERWREISAAVRDAVWDAAWDAARAAVRAAVWAANEIQGMDIMLAKGQQFYFLAKFGFAKPQDIPLSLATR